MANTARIDDTTAVGARPEYVRFPSELSEKIDTHHRAMMAAAPAGVTVTRAGAIRNLVELGLESQARSAARRGKR